MPRFSEDFLDRVREAVTIEDVVADYVALKRSGKRLRALCPFHSEKTPSFTVSPETGLFYCYGCHKGGNVFNFLMEIEGIAFPDAVERLAERAGIPLPAPEGGDWGADVLSCNKWAAMCFKRYLLSGRGAAAAVRSYVRDRGITKESLEKFGLGACPDQWQFLAKLAERENRSLRALDEAGLVTRRRDGTGYVDRFRNRLMFPLASPSGEILGFAGRILPGSTEKAKYVNSPETAVYKKSRFVYGFHQARSALREKNRALLVEGYLDVIQCHQFGYDEAVSVSGTALTKEQVQTLKRRVGEIVLLFDADSPGQAAAERAVGVIWGEDIEPRVARLPLGEDPDSILRKSGREALERIVNESTSAVSFLVDRLPEAARNRSGEAVRQLTTVLSGISDPLIMEEAAKELASYFPVSAHSILSHVARQRRSSRESWLHETGSGRQPLPRAVAWEEQICRHMLLRPAERESIGEDVLSEQFSDGSLSALFSWLVEHAASEEAVRLIEKMTDDSMKRLATRLTVTQEPLEPVEEELARFRLEVILREIQHLKNKTRDAEGNGDVEEVKRLSVMLAEKRAAAEGLKSVIGSSFSPRVQTGDER